MNVRSFFHNIPAFCSFCSSSNSASRDLERIAAREQKHFFYKTLSRATDKFNADRKLGEGGFGPVYRGKLEDGREIAVKRLTQTSKQGKKEFLNEARLLLRVQHRNVVNLLGYCVRGEDKLLVYEYVPHESLDKLLLKPGKREELDWKKRYDIILGIAKGLHYLHEDAHCCIIHRDIKASNILLDDKWTPKIADFGMARLFSKDETRENTGIAGTNGYMAPEYLMYGQLTVKADVFSFGVLILELVSGQKNSSVNMSPDADNLVAWAYKMFQKGKSLEIMDPALAPAPTPTPTPTVHQVALCIHIGLLCVQSDPSLRPTMERVTVMLTKRPSNLEGPTRPGNTNVRVYHRSSRPTSSYSNATTSAACFSSTSQSNTTSTNTNTASVGSNVTTTSSASGSSEPGLMDLRGKHLAEA